MRLTKASVFQALWVTAGLCASSMASDFQWKGRAGQTLEIKGVNGPISAEPATGPEAEVTAVKRGRRSDPTAVRIEVVEHAGGVTICAVYPTAEGKETNACRPGSAGRMHTHDNDVSVAFEVRVPPGTSFVARTVNGGVKAARLSGDVEAHTVNGTIAVGTRGNAVAQTVNGSIVASAGKADWRGSAEFKTVNGSITVSLPEDASATVEASTVNGGIATDFPLQVRGRYNSKRASGNIGNGGRALSLVTVNGDIRLQQASSAQD